MRRARDGQSIADLYLELLEPELNRKRREILDKYQREQFLNNPRLAAESYTGSLGGIPASLSLLGQDAYTAFDFNDPMFDLLHQNENAKAALKELASSGGSPEEKQRWADFLDAMFQIEDGAIGLFPILPNIGAIGRAAFDAHQAGKSDAEAVKAAIGSAYIDGTSLLGEENDVKGIDEISVMDILKSFLPDEKETLKDAMKATARDVMNQKGSLKPWEQAAIDGIVKNYMVEHGIERLSDLDGNELAVMLARIGMEIGI